jgi:hypothetical protein
MILNQDVDFADAAQEVKTAFLRHPEKMRLNAGTHLYKFTDRPLVPGRPVTPWWFPVEQVRLPSGAIAEGFRTSEERARRIHRSHREYARARAAISERFGNSMTNLLIVALKVPVWGFAGIAGGQPQFPEEQVDAQNVILIGGAHQLWIPGLGYSDVRQVSVIG